MLGKSAKRGLDGLNVLINSLLTMLGSWEFKKCAGAPIVLFMREGSVEMMAVA